jgi:hypothetical protein
MNILSAIFPKAKKVASEAIAGEIERAEADLAATHEKLAHVFDGLAVMNDEQHAAAEDKATTFRRCGERLQARIVALRSEHETAIAAEAEAAKVAAEAAHQKRIEAARNAVEVEGADLLREYCRLANAMAGVLTRVAEIDEEAKACQVPSIDQTHRKHPDRPEAVVTEPRPCWVYRYPGSPADTGKTRFQYEAPREEVRPATIGADGKAVPGGTEIHNYYGRELVITPVLETRNITVGRQRFRPGRVEDSLGSVRLPPAFTGAWHWPRQ